MKKALFAGMLVASQWCTAQQVVEGTNNSWDYPDHSIEVYQDFVVTGCTERNNAGFLSPMFKITIVNLTNFSSFNLDFQTDVVLMDFFIRADPGVSPTIVLTGMTADQNNPTKMYIAEVDLNGNFIRSSWFNDPAGESLIPHQVIYTNSQAPSRVMVVGTKAAFQPGVPPNIPMKEGFILEVDANNYPAITIFEEMNSPNVGPSDNDMLESVCEVPGCGYFMTGSANNPQFDEQNLLTMGIDYFGNVLHSNIWDNTNYQYAGASVLCRTTGTQQAVYVLANNSLYHTFEVAAFNGCTGAQGTPFYRYNVTSLPVPPGGGIDVNGFKLRMTNNNQVIITGYISAPTGILGPLLMPFQMLLSANLATFLQGKLYAGSNNNSPLSGYFDESGSSVYINTPDVAAYSTITQKTYVVNPNTGTGYDVSTSTPAVVSGCEKGLKIQQQVFNVPIVGQANYNFAQIQENSNQFPITPRAIHDAVICPFMIATNPSAGTATIYPNPATAELGVTVESDIREIVITDVKGNVVMRTTGSERNAMHATLDISRLGTGVYLIDITDTEGVTHREKFIKE